MSTCKLCKVDKLSNEFPPTTVSEDCDHPPLICLRCVVNWCKEKETCPHPGCTVHVSEDAHTIQWFTAILEEMFKEYDTTYTPSVPQGLGSTVLNITVLNGDAFRIPYMPSMRLSELQAHIEANLKIPRNKQKLLYDNKEIMIYKPNGQSYTLSESNIPPFATLYLVVLLYEIPEDFNHVVFDLHWGYPFFGRDYLDASCLAYQNTQFIGLVDFGHRQVQGITHSGDLMDDMSRIGHHTIHVYLKELPSNFTHLFFTLSAWNSPNISKYPNPSLKFYEASNIHKDLCKTTFTHANNSQAVVMCSVSRSSQGRWGVYESGKLSAGNANHYGPIKNTIRNLIESGY